MKLAHHPRSKRCTKCLKAKSLKSGFYKTPLGKYGLRSTCKECCRAASQKWMNSNRDSFRLYARERYIQNRHRLRFEQLLRKYGISESEYDELHAAQSGTCAICLFPETSKDWRGSTRRLAVDHDHRTGRIRGLLCYRCNVSLGTLEKSGTKRIQRYLKKDGMEPGFVRGSCGGCENKRRCVQLKVDFKITLADFNRMLRRQSGTCTLCCKPDPSGRSLAVDHNHETGRIRGLLCMLCNTALGRFEKNIDTLLRMMDYLGIGGPP